MTDTRLKTALTIIREETARLGVDARRILLFGSRARGEAHPDSDWDFLVLVDRGLERALRLRLEQAIGVRLVLARLPADVLILTTDQFDAYKQDVGHIAYYAHKEGVAL